MINRDLEQILNQLEKYGNAIEKLETRSSLEYLKEEVKEYLKYVKKIKYSYIGLALSLGITIGVSKVFDIQGKNDATSTLYSTEATIYDIKNEKVEKVSYYNQKYEKLKELVVTTSWRVENEYLKRNVVRYDLTSLDYEDIEDYSKINTETLLKLPRKEIEETISIFGNEWRINEKGNIKIILLNQDLNSGKEYFDQIKYIFPFLINLTLTLFFVAIIGISFSNVRKINKKYKEDMEYFIDTFKDNKASFLEVLKILDLTEEEKRKYEGVLREYDFDFVEENREVIDEIDECLDYFKETKDDYEPLTNVYVKKKLNVK